MAHHTPTEHPEARGDGGPVQWEVAVTDENGQWRNASGDTDLAGATGTFIILISPDGTRWQVGVDNAGAMTTTAV